MDGRALDPTLITRDTYDRIARDYCAATRTYPSVAALQSVLRRFREMLPSAPRILVVGAGDGRDGKALSEQGCQVTCLDYSDGMLAVLREDNPGLVAIKGDVRKLPFHTEEFEAVWASTCLYHLPGSDLPLALSELHRVLIPGGFLYANFREGSGEGLVARPRSYPSGGPRYYAFYSEESLRRMFVGFEVIELWRAETHLDDYIQVVLKRES